MARKKALNLSLFLIFLLAIILRIPSFFEPYWYGDEGIYLTLGLALRKGLVFYKDIHDNKPPLLYLLAAIAGSQSTFRTILLFVNLANIYLIYLFVKKIFVKKNLALLSSFFFVLLPVFLEGNVANAEIFMILPTTAAFLLFLEKKYFFSGILFSLAVLFKVPALFDFLAAVIFLLFFSETSVILNLFQDLSLNKRLMIPKQVRNDLSKLVILSLGFIFPIGLTFVYYWLNGGLSQYLTAAFLQNLPYLTSWGEKQKSLFSSGFFQRTIFLSGLCLAISLMRKKLKRKTVLLALWFVFSLFAALLSGRPYPHYLIQITPPTVLLLGSFFTKNVPSRITSACLLSLIPLALIKYQFWSYPVFPYYKNFYQFVVGSKTREEYFSFFDWRVNQTYKVSRYIKTHTKEGEKIFLWGNEPYIYALAQRLPVGRYTVLYHIVDFEGFQETAKALSEKKPSLIIKFDYQEKEFPFLDNFLKEEYLLVKKIDQALVYKRIAGI